LNVDLSLRRPVSPARLVRPQRTQQLDTASPPWYPTSAFLRAADRAFGSIVGRVRRGRRIRRPDEVAVNLHVMCCV
jgi:hypothetical protein